MKEDREDLVIPFLGKFLCEPSHARALRKKYAFSCLRLRVSSVGDLSNLGTSETRDLETKTVGGG